MKYVKYFAIVLLISGCKSYQYLDNDFAEGEVISTKEKAFIINPELKDECEILKNSDIYEITNDENSSIKIELKPIEERLMSGTPLIFTFFTFGLIPGSVVDQYKYSFVEKRENKIIEREVVMAIKMRASLYEIFFNGNINDQIAEGVRKAYYAN